MGAVFICLFVVFVDVLVVFVFIVVVVFVVVVVCFLLQACSCYFYEVVSVWLYIFCLSPYLAYVYHPSSRVYLLHGPILDISKLVVSKAIAIFLIFSRV